MKCKEVELALEQDGLSPLPAVAKAHIAECSACRNVVEDLFAVVNAAHALPAEVEPPARLWVSLRAQLESEGVIRGSAAAEKSSWLETLSEFFRSRALATATAGLLIFAAAYFEVRQTPELPPRVTQAYPSYAADTASYSSASAILDQQETEIASLVPAGGVATPVNASLHENLQIVNKFIADCKQRVEEDPQDDLAHEYLNGAYQQKAQLLAAMMERGGGGN